MKGGPAVQPGLAGTMAPRAGRGHVRAVAAAALSTTVGTLPTMLLGGLAVLVREDLAISRTQLGAAVSVFFASSALWSMPAGRAAERFGAFRSTAAAAVFSGVSVVAIAALARSWLILVVCLAASGIGNAFAQIGSNLSLARHVPKRLQGLAFGIKQAAIPIGTLLGGLALPLVGLTVGWRWAFAGAGVLAVMAVFATPRDAPSPGTGRDRRRGDAALLGLVVVAVGAALGAGTANAFGTFLVESAVSDGIAAGTAGLMLAAGSAIGIAVRIWLGWSADRRQGGNLRIVTLLLACGAVGFALLAVGGVTALIAGTVLGFGAGWSWPGLLNLAVVRLNPGAPAMATSVTQTGVFAGGAAGPVTFGAVVDAAGYQVAWSSAAAALLVAAGAILLGRRILLADRDRREPPARAGSAPEAV